MSEMSKLLPCPFCGGTNIQLSEGTTFRWRYVVCSECGAQIEFRSDNRFKPTEQTWRDAAEAWNRRTPTHPSAEAVREACAKACSQMIEHPEFRDPGNASYREGYEDGVNDCALECRALSQREGYVMVKMEPLEKVQVLLTGLLVASCSCDTKSPDVDLHKQVCRYRNISETLALLDAALSAAQGREGQNANERGRG